MMVKSCCAPGCHNRSGDVEGRSFYRLPKDQERREAWISAMNRGDADKIGERWKPQGDHWRLCSDHFVSGKQTSFYIELNLLIGNLYKKRDLCCVLLVI